MTGRPTPRGRRMLHHRRPGLPEWMNRVQTAINEPSVRLYVTLDGLDGATPGMSDTEKALARIQASVRRGKDLAGMQVVIKDAGTDWELALISKSFYLHGRAPDSVSWYMNGKDISAEVWALLPKDTEEWLIFRGVK